MQTKITHFIISFYTFSFISLLLSSIPASSDPQTQLLLEGCSHDNVPNAVTFFSNLNDTLSNLRSQLNSTRFATATNALVTGLVSDPVYGLFQCRDYLSTADCITCFTAAASMIRNCATAFGANIIFDGCYLRYEGNNNFFDQSTLVGNAGFCGNKTVSKESGFNDTAGQLLRDLTVATPRISGYFAAVKREGGGGAVVYGVAQCARTVSESGCGDCLRVAYGNIQRCPPAADGRAVDAGCFLRYSNTAFFSANQSTNISPYLSDAGGSKSKNAKIGSIVGGVVLVLLLVLLFSCYGSSKKARKNRLEIIGATELRGPVIFQYGDLKSATSNFSDKNKLGRGGFGEVYKGVMRDGKAVAVKKLIVRQSERVKEDFQMEVKLINNVHHRNLVQLLGCCSKGPELLLVYEFMPNNSLDKYLFGERRGTLNWKQRLDIIIGTARGLAYLHEEFHICIIHRDIKPNNILLDNEFQPKIADFGLSRLLPGDRSHLSTKFAGTLGYMAPEYAVKGKLSEKVDVYSYGVVVLEIVSGRNIRETTLEPIAEHLIQWAWRLYEEGSLMELVDDSLDPNELDSNEVKKVIEIGLMCTQSVDLRPTMSNVVVLLMGNGELGHTLTRPDFINSTHSVQTRLANGELPKTIESTASNATMSISKLYAR